MRLVALLGALLSAQLLLADQITLKNGDRITGSIVNANGKEVVFETPTEGKVTIQRDAIATIAAEGPIYVDLADGRTISGAVTTVNDQLQIAGTAVPFADVKEMRNQAEEAKAARYRNPRIFDLWGGFFDIGFAGARGNANTSTFNMNTRANRVTKRDKISVYYTQIYSSTSTTGASTTGTRVATANAKRGGITYDINFDGRWFGWASTDFESDQFQSLNLRFIPAGGVGLHAINTDPTKLDFRLGISDNHENFSTGLHRNSVEAMFGEDFTHDFSKTTSIQQHLRIFPNLTNTPNARINFDLALITALKNWLSLQLSLSDRYLSNPVPNHKTNDVLFSAGVRVTWGLQ